VSALEKPVGSLKEVGSARERAFREVGVETVGDLLRFFPTRHLDRATSLDAAQAWTRLVEGFEGEMTIVGRAVDMKSKFPRKREMLQVAFADEKGVFEAVWFRGAKFVKPRIEIGERYAVGGKPSDPKRGVLQFAHPDFERMTDDDTKRYHTGGMIPVYPKPRALKEGYLGEFSLRRIIKDALDRYGDEIEETLPRELLERRELPDLARSIRDVHFPESREALEAATRRLKYEELFEFELATALKRGEAKGRAGIAHKARAEELRAFVETLPFELTPSQREAFKAIYDDLRAPRPTHRLLHGDVGSGKTVVALLAAFVAVQNGYQVAFMAPTEILAAQHFQTIETLLDPYRRASGDPITVAFAAGGVNARAHRASREMIRSGHAKIVVGTHALFEESVEFANLGLAIVDEQHRFGVRQRLDLRKKGTAPDLLVMSATPIPRTLAMTLYGDLDVAAIKRSPKGRRPIVTAVRGENALPAVYEWVAERAKAGVQSYIVFPLVEESEKLPLKSVVKEYESLVATRLKGLRTGLLHGKMKWEEKEETMRKFAAGEYDALATTTVVEVGVDVPTANIMIVHNAERFGLSQLHQLRGRVGRGKEKGYCVLIADDRIVADLERELPPLETASAAELDRYRAAIRMRTMIEERDGFKIAEIDLKLRGPGDYFGVRQSGAPQFRFANLREDFATLEAAKEDAFALAEKDPGLRSPEHAALRRSFAKRAHEKLEVAGAG
jgi:ATP-dependent DNA helicase RecG